MNDQHRMNENIFSPQQAGSLTIEHLEKLKSISGKGLKTGISGLDRILLPMRGGELIPVIGNTSNYKSGLMDFIPGSATNQIMGFENEIVICATWEQSVEESTLNWVARHSHLSLSSLTRGSVSDNDWKVVMKAYSDRLSVPMWIIGHSLENSTSRPRLTMNDVYQGVEYICEKATDQILKPRLILLDYLQRIRPDKGDGGTRREQMMEAVNKAKDLAVAFGATVLLGVQATRDVLDRKNKLPRMDDGQETSNIEQSADKVLSVWYPIKSEEAGSMVNSMPVDENLLIIGVLKQKMGSAPHTVNVKVNPEQNIITGFMPEIK